VDKRWIEITLNIIFWVVSSWVIIAFYSVETHGTENVNGENIVILRRNNHLVYYFFVVQVFFALYFYTQLYLFQKLRISKNIVLFLIKTLVLSFVCIMVYTNGVKHFSFPGSIKIPTISHAIFGFYMAVAIGYGVIKLWIKDEQDKNQIKLVKNQVELNMLRSQLHPHFLFNTMNNLLSMVDQKENPKLATSIDKLSELLRYVVYDTKRAEVMIAEEVNFIRNYAELQLMRFTEDEIDYRFTLKGKNDQQPIEPGILLCFVENAFKHGVLPEVQSFIHILVDVSDIDSIIFEIENSIPSEAGIKEEGGYGLSATKDRLDLAYANRHTLVIKENKTYFIRLKIETNESNNS